MVAFGIHVFSWPEECEEVAAERIKAASKKRLLGNKFPAREAWYHRKCLSRVYFLSPIILLASASVLTTKVLPKLHLHNFVSSFEKTKCTTASVNLTSLELNCNCKAKKSGPDCQKTYHCLQFEVIIRTKKGIKIRTNLYEDMEALHLKYEKCAVLNRECKKHDPEHLVVSLYEHYGKEGSQFACLYNPHEESEVILHVKALKISFWAFFVFVTLCLGLSVIAPLIAYLTCGFMYVCTKTPPPDIQAEADRRAAGVPEGEEMAPLSPPAPEEPAPEPAPAPQTAPTTPVIPPQMIGQPMPQQQMGVQTVAQPGMYMMPPPYNQSLPRPASGVSGVMPYPMMGGMMMPGTPLPMMASAAKQPQAPVEQMSTSSSPIFQGGGSSHGSDGATYMPSTQTAPDLSGAQFQPIQAAPFMYMPPGTVGGQQSQMMMPGYYSPYMGYGAPLQQGMAPQSGPESMPSQPPMQPPVQPSAQYYNQLPIQPAIQPPIQPSAQYYNQPPIQPSIQPSAQYYNQPPTQPSIQPPSQPSIQPPSQPSTQHPSQTPAQLPVPPASPPPVEPSGSPSIEPSSQTSGPPSIEPSSEISGPASIEPPSLTTAPTSLETSGPNSISNPPVTTGT